MPQIYYPGIAVTEGSGTTALGKAGYWYQTPNSYNIDSKISRNIGKHYVKAGGEYRRDNTNASRPQYMRFDFKPVATANTFNNPNTALSRRRLGEFPARRDGVQLLCLHHPHPAPAQ